MNKITKEELINLIEIDFDNAIEHICDSICLYNHLLKILKKKAKTKEIKEKLEQFKQSDEKIIFKDIDGDEMVFISYFESDVENVDNQLRLPIRLFLDTDSYLAEIDCLVEYLNDKSEHSRQVGLDGVMSDSDVDCAIRFMSMGFPIELTPLQRECFDKIRITTH